MAFFQRQSPRLAEWTVNKIFRNIQNSSFKIRPEWNFSPPCSFRDCLPIISDDLVRILEEGSVESVVGVREVVGADAVELTDGTRLQVDTIIYCTGYKNDFSLLDPSVDPCRETAGWADHPGVKDSPFPKLYRNIISLDYPDSLAIMGCALFPAPSFQCYDLASMAVGQIWANRSKLPPAEEMQREVDERLERVRRVAAERKVLTPGSVSGPEWMKWANEAAGTGVDRYLGWGLDGIKFWLGNWKLCGMLMGELFSPHVYRLFETGKRKRWDGAEVAIREVNERVRKSHAP